jgi:glutamine amidotransferase
VESPGVAGLDVIHGTVELIEGNVRRPQMQWNELHVENEDPLFAGLPKTPWVYFVHSYSAVPADSSVVVATCEYGRNLTAVVRQENVVATQFHPEKSAKDGLKLLHNFVSSCS